MLNVGTQGDLKLIVESAPLPALGLALWISISICSVQARHPVSPSLRASLCFYLQAQHTVTLRKAGQHPPSTRTDTR